MCTCVELTTEVPVELLDRHLPVILHALFVNIDSDSILVFRLSKVGHLYVFTTGLMFFYVIV
jgi:hypothetical protein